MNCPECGSTSSVYETRTESKGKVVTRRRRCDSCGATWKTEERVQRASIIASKPVPTAPLLAHTCPTNRENPPISGLDLGSKEGFSLVSPLQSPSDLSPQKESTTRAQTAGTVGKTAHEYTPEWEDFWATTNGKGSKWNAFKAWQKLGRPDLAKLTAAWADWMRSPDWVKEGGRYQQQVVTWLNGRMYEQRPPGVDRRVAVVPGRRMTDDPLAAFHAGILADTAKYD